MSAQNRLQRLGHWSIGSSAVVTMGLVMGYEHHNWVGVAVIHFIGAVIFFGLARAVDAD